MPVYEYVCAACRQPFSKFFKSQSAAAAPLSCPNCGAADVQSTLSRFQTQLSEKSKIEQIDPRIEREIDWAGRHDRATDPLNRMNLNFDRND
jgi:putative FmdB family regulatory protein